MAANIEGMLKKGCWWVPRRPAFFFSAIWVGSQMAAYALVVGLMLSGQKFDLDMVLLIVGSPLLVFSGWIWINAFVMGGAIAKFWHIESLNARGWGIFAGIESVFALLAMINDVQGPLAVGATWGTWLVLTGMLATGVWFVHQWERNRWAGEIAILKAENASRLARKDAREDAE